MKKKKLKLRKIKKSKIGSHFKIKFDKDVSKLLRQKLEYSIHIENEKEKEKEKEEKIEKSSKIKDLSGIKNEDDDRLDNRCSL